MKTKLFSAILTLLALVSFSFHCQAGDPPKQDQSKAINPQTVSRPRVEEHQSSSWDDLYVVYLLDGQGQVLDVYFTSLDNLPIRMDVPGSDMVVYPYFVNNQLDTI